MNLSPMRFKDFTWPHNPRIYDISFKRHVTCHKVPFGHYVLQDMGVSHRILKGEGEFNGEHAYDDFKKLASLFSDSSPGILSHPVWQASSAYLVALDLRQIPREDFVSYSFEFWECYDLYSAEAEIVQVAPVEPVIDEVWYSVVYGDTLWDISIRNGMTLNELLAINPQVKNPNILYPGDQIRIK